MFKHSSKTHLKLTARLLAVTAACVLLAMTNVNAQYKGIKRVFKTVAVSDQLAPTAQPAYNIDQCANLTPGCDWINGELGHQNSDYAEGDSVPFRVKMTNLTIGSKYTYTINWDGTDNPTPNHGYDYLTSYDRTVPSPNLCLSVSGCSAAVDTEPIPIDDVVRAGRDGILGTADDVVQAQGVFTMLGGTITNVGPYVYTPAANFNQAVKVSITITFTANAETVVLAWGGHISTRLDWGNKSAIAFPGSPYHMRNGSFCTPPLDVNGNPTDCKTGNADLQIKVAEVEPITGIRIIKQVNVPDGISTVAFPFISTGGAPLPGNFSLIDDNTITDRITQLYDTNGTIPGPISVLEDLTTLPFWQNTQITCSITSGGGGSVGTVLIGQQQVTVTLTAGDFAECTFVNIYTGTTAANASVTGRVMTKSGVGIRGALVTIFDASTGTTKTAMTNTFGYYRFTELPVEDFYVMTVSAKRYTFSNPQQSFVIQGDLADINFTSDQ